MMFEAKKLVLLGTDKVIGVFLPFINTVSNLGLDATVTLSFVIGHL